ncbi:MAG: DUF4038 domain-containing protein [Armatimonadota bacterium]
MVLVRCSAFAVVCLLALHFLASPAAAQGQRLLLRVHDSGRYLTDGDGQPFFWLGDTAWGLFGGLTEAETAEYLDDRADRGFNVVQAVLAWPSKLVDENGEAPWLDGNPATPNPAYFDRVARIVEMAAERDIVMALLPAWGDYVTVNETINADNAYDYGNWLGVRLGGYPNVVWVLGGDRLPDGHEDVFRQIVAGISDGEELPHLMTYHPRGGGHSSAEFFHEDEWLDLNMIQTAHSIGYPDHRRVEADYALAPVKPTLVGEPRYENITHGLRDAGPRIDDCEVRRAAWAAVLSGACGHTYGANGIFQFATAGEQTRWKPVIGWRTAKDLPGARHMGVMREFMKSIDWTRLRPAAEMIAGNTDDAYRIAAAITDSGDLAVAYFPEYTATPVDLRRIGGEGVRAEWLNPRTGARERIGEFEQDSAPTFQPPTGNEDPDYLLVLQSARPDTTPPQIAAVSAGGDPSQVRVRFSEPVARATAERAESYAVQPEVMVQGAELSAGATVVTLTTTPMTEREYTLTVSGVADRWEPPNVVEPDTTATFTWAAGPPRATDGLVALYTFDALEDGAVADGSDVAEPLSLAIEDGSAADVLDGELVVAQDSLIASQRPATELSEAIVQTGEATIEAWVQPGNLEQGGPARIVTLSRDSGQRNFTLGQEGERFVVRFRTTETDANGMPSLDSPEGEVTTDLTHVAYTRAADGTARLYVNGREVATRGVPGELTPWSDQYRLGLANELTRDRPWLGAIRLVAIYDRALTADEVAGNYEAGE